LVRGDGGAGSGAGDRGRGNFFANYDFLAVVTSVTVMMVVVMAVTVDRVQDTVGGAVETVAERMVRAVSVVVSHIRLALLGSVNGSPRFYSDVSGAC
jgi:hypothetical protein